MAADRKSLQGLSNLVNYNEVVPVSIAGVAYKGKGTFEGTLQSMSGADKDLWLREVAGMAGSESGSAKISDLQPGHFSRVISYCLRDSENNRVDVEFIQSLDSKIVDKLYAASMELSGNNGDAEEVAKND